MKIEGVDLESRPGERDRALERHVQSGLLALVLMLLAWIGYSIPKLEVRISEVAGATNLHLAQIDERVATLQAQVMSTYRTSDAQRDVLDSRNQIEEMRRRIGALESTISLSRKQQQDLRQWSK